MIVMRRIVSGMLFGLVVSACWMGAGGCDVNVTPAEDQLSVCVVDEATGGNCTDFLFGFEDDRLTLKAEASGGMGPFVYRWNIEVIPDDPDDPFDGNILPIPDNVGEEILSIPLQLGRHVYRVVVSDAMGNSAMDFVEINVAAQPLTVEITEAPDDDDASITVLSGQEFTLSAVPNEENVTYLWAGIGELFVDIDDEEAQTITARIDQIGETTIAVRAFSDDDSRVGQDNVTITVVSSVEVDRPEFLAPNEGTTLSARIVNSGLTNPTYFWEVKSRIDNAVFLEPRTESTTLATPVVFDTFDFRLTVTADFEGEEVSIIRLFAISVIDSNRPRVVMQVASDTEGVNGRIVYELFPDAAPINVTNFLRYIDSDFYSDVLWHRVAENQDSEPFVVQCGGFVRGDGFIAPKDPIYPPIMGEPNNGISNQLTTIAMALTGNNPDSGTTQFFVNLNDNSQLDDMFTVFGEVVEGMDIIDAMAGVERTMAAIEGGGTLSDVPRVDIVITSFTRERAGSSGPLLGGN